MLIWLLLAGLLGGKVMGTARVGTGGSLMAAGHMLSSCRRWPRTGRLYNSIIFVSWHATNCQWLCMAEMQKEACINVQMLLACVVVMYLYLLSQCWIPNLSTYEYKCIFELQLGCCCFIQYPDKLPLGWLYQARRQLFTITKNALKNKEILL